MTSQALKEALDGFAAHRCERAARPASLFDAQVEAVADNAGPAWLAETLKVIRSVAAGRGELTADDVNRAGVPPTYDLRALGAAMREAARRGWIRSTGEYRRSDRPERHGSPVLVWRSLLHATGPPSLAAPSTSATSQEETKKRGAMT